MIRSTTQATRIPAEPRRWPIGIDVHRVFPSHRFAANDSRVDAEPIPPHRGAAAVPREGLGIIAFISVYGEA
jgi:hypothetical protein